MLKVNQIRSETGSFVVMWMNLESVSWNEASQKEKNRYLILTHMLYMKSRKMVRMNLFVGQESRCGHTECLVDTVGKGRVG